MSGPAKHNYGDRLGDVTQYNYDFLKELWGANGPQLRDRLFNQPDEATLRTLLGEWHIIVDPGVRIMLVDVQNARVKSYVQNPGTDDFYVLVLPPVPTRNPGEPHYRDMQGWTAAHYHAVNDSYGM